MIYSEKWLREWVNPAISSAELVAQITLAGLEVDDVVAASGDFQGVIVAEIISADQHPNADKLQVCQVFDGQQQYQVVCGAPNVREGIKVAFAQVGAVLPGNFKIKTAKLRQVESFGMLCSAAELKISEDHDGIMELSQDAPLGVDLIEYMQLDDNLIDIDLTPNRGDCLSIAGLAREVGVLNSVALNIPAIAEVAPTIEDTFPVKISSSEDCPRLTARVIRGVDIKQPTPQWMQEKLRRSGIRSIDAVVDVTAYVMLELGQPLHAYDLHKLNGSLYVRRASQGEQLTLLNDSVCELNEQVLVIADSEGAIGMAGIMGGNSTGVGGDTQDILLEAAFFNPIAIAGKARSFGLHTDASHRFERGVDFDLPRKAMERATRLLLDICGGQAGPVIEQTSPEDLPQANFVTLRKAKLSSILAYEFTDTEVENILTRLGLEILSQDQKGWCFKVPSWRFDIAIEADLIEEVARVYGYNNLPSTQPTGSMTIASQPEKKIPLSSLRYQLVSRGYYETVTYSMIEPSLQAKIDKDNTPVALANPISQELSVMRTSLWPGLIKAAQHNLNRQQSRMRLFETGQCFIPSDQGLQQVDYISGLLTGSRIAESWHGKSSSVDFYDVKGDVESLLTVCGADYCFGIEPAQKNALHPNQSAAVYKQKGKEKTLVGYLGTLHPAIAVDLGLPNDVFLFELLLAPLQEGSVPIYQAVSKYPEVRRDMAIVIREDIGFAEIEKVIDEEAGEFLCDVNLFDVYQGKGIADNYKSLALSLVWQHSERTLNDQEVNDWFSHSVTALQQQLSAQLRE